MEVLQSYNNDMMVIKELSVIVFLQNMTQRSFEFFHSSFHHNNATLPQPRLTQISK